MLCNNGQAIGDGVNANDLPFLAQMPYLASPHSGDAGPNDPAGPVGDVKR